MTKGNCPHGEFELEKGCPECIFGASIAGSQERENQANPQIIKVRYLAENTGELSPREYTYFSVDRLVLGEIVEVPVRDTEAKAQVSKVDVPESEIEAFRDKVKTIPAGSRAIKTEPYVMPEEMRGVRISNPRFVDDIVDKLKEVAPQFREMEEGLNSEGLTLADSLKDVDVMEVMAEDAEKPGTEIQEANWYHEGIKLQEYAEARVIKTKEDNEHANDDLTAISRLKKLMEQHRKELVKPKQDEISKINENYKYWMEPVLTADRITREKMVGYVREQERVEREQKEINRKRMEAAEAEMKLKGELSEPVNLVEVQEAPTKVNTESGSSGMRDNWKYRIVNRELIPREYLIEDTVLLNNTAKKYHDQKPVAGVEFYNEPIISNRPR